MKPYLALEASAGSGKTFALSVRFVALILKGAKINEILALTFTKKAANEMLKRIIDTFLNLEHKESEQIELSKMLNINTQELLNLRDRKKEEFLRSELKISTFDAFFAKILRVFALNLGLSSDFQINEEKFDTKEIFLKLLDKNELKALAFYLSNFDENLKLFDELEFFYENAYVKQSDFQNFPLKHEINALYEDLRLYCLSLNNKNLNSNFKDETLELNTFLKTPFMKDFENKKYLQLLSTNQDFMTKRQAFLSALNSYALKLEEYKIYNISKLSQKYTKAKNLIYEQKNALSFSDVSKKVFELINSDFKDMIYFRLDGFISHLLIDEFQDTSVLQYQILKPLIAELVSGQGVKTNRSFFYVGDKKQSIYRFRKSKKELFDLLKHEFKQIQKDNLNTNYRCKEQIVEFVNETFKDKIQNYTLQLSIKKGGFVRVTQSKEENLEQIKQKTLDELLTQIQFLQAKNVNLDEICILCWKNSDADMILDFLSKNNIQAFTQSNILLENKASVKLVLEYVKYCLFEDEFYLVFLKELLGFAPEKLHLNLNPVEAILQVINALKLSLDSALIQLIEHAKTKTNLLALLFEPLNIKIISEHSFGISIMTIHKSKGLEFENVILLDSLSRPEPDLKNVLLEYDINKGWELRIRSEILKLVENSEYNEFIAKIKQANQEDDLNKLYVAFTRAKNALIIICRNKNFSDLRYPSFLNTYLNLQCLEKGELKTQEKLYTKQTSTNLTLQYFEKIPLQEVDTSFESKNALQASSELYFGNAFHAFMQDLKLPSAKNYLRLKAKISSDFKYFLNSFELEDLCNRVSKLVKNEKFLTLIQNKQILKEQNICYENEILRLDCLALNEDEAIILDYKTGLVTQKHKEQVRLYKKAIEDILAKKKTRAFLVYCLKNEIKIVES